MSTWSFSSPDELYAAAKAAEKNATNLQHSIKEVLIRVLEARRIRHSAVLSDSDRARLLFFKWRMQKENLDQHMLAGRQCDE